MGDLFMFEFFKKFNFLNNNNNNDIVKRISYGDINGVSINDGGSEGVSYFATNYEHLEINNFLQDIGLESISFSEILVMLGFDKDKKIWLERIPSEKDEISFSFKYMDKFDEDVKRNKITIYKNPDNYRGYNRYKIKVFNDDYKLVYYLSMEGNNLKLKLEEDYVRENVNDKIYMRRVYDGGFRINVKNNLFSDEIWLVCKKNNVSQVVNEEELKEYLLNIDDSVGVNDVYKKICEISLGNEKNYEKISLSLVKDNKVVESVEKYDKLYFGSIGPDYRCDILENGKRCIFICDRDGESKIIKFVKDNYIIIIRMYDNEIFKDKIALRKYFMKLEFPVKINELCIDFRDKFLLDLNNIPYFKIEFYVNDVYGDNLFIKDGKVHNFEMTIGDKKLLINDELMFYYSFRSLKGLIEVDMSMDRDIVTRYEIELEDGIENEDMGNVMYNVINSVRDEKVRTRKMINEMLNKDNN